MISALKREQAYSLAIETLEGEHLAAIEDLWVQRDSAPDLKLARKILRIGEAISILETEMGEDKSSRRAPEAEKAIHPAMKAVLVRQAAERFIERCKIKKKK